MLIDSHAHVSPVWYEPVETLLGQMKRHGVARAVLTQMIGQVDNRYQTDCVRAHPGRFASVVWIDAAAPDAPRLLARLADEGAGGVRLRPGARSPGDDPLAIWKAAEACGLPVSCVGNAEAFTAPAFADLLQAVPGLTVVLEHLGDTSKPMETEADGELRYTVPFRQREPQVARPRRVDAARTHRLAGRPHVRRCGSGVAGGRHCRVQRTPPDVGQRFPGGEQSRRVR
jgi:L-fuconolactonase